MSRPLKRPLANKAHSYVKRAIERGHLLPVIGQRCADCGGEATQYDHRDYTKPLEVDPVCRRCNKRRGPGYPYNRAAGFNACGPCARNKRRGPGYPYNQ